MSLVEHGFFLHIDPVAGGSFLGQLHIIAHLALEADVRHQPQAGLGIDAGHVAGVGIAIGVAVLHVEEKHEVITVRDGRHGSSP